MKFKFWPDKKPAPEEGHGADSQATTDEMIVNELFMETSLEEHWQFVPDGQAPEHDEAMFAEIDPAEIDLMEEDPLPEVEQLHLPVPLPELVSEAENVVRLSDVRRQKEENRPEEDPQLPDAEDIMVFTPEGDVGFEDEDSYAETLSRYRREVILDGAKFTTQSINSLVEGYFNNGEH